MITHIKLEKFKRVIEFETDLDDINVLVGTNNSGKSSVLQGIQFTIMAEVARRVSGVLLCHRIDCCICHPLILQFLDMIVLTQIIHGCNQFAHSNERFRDK